VFNNSNWASPTARFQNTGWAAARAFGSFLIISEVDPAPGRMEPEGSRDLSALVLCSLFAGGLESANRSAYNNTEHTYPDFCAIKDWRSPAAVSSVTARLQIAPVRCVA